MGKALGMTKRKAKVTKGMSLVIKLKKSQKELIKSKVIGIAKKYDKPSDMKPLIIAKDGHIVDGHHRWAAAIYKFGNDVKIPTITIHLNKNKQIALYNSVAKSLGEKSEEEKADYVKGYEPVDETTIAAVEKKWLVNLNPNLKGV